MGGNILDLVLTSDPERILEVDYGPPLGNVKIGYAIINITYGIKVEREENPNIYKKVVEKANFQGIRDEINKVDWDTTLNGLWIEEHIRVFCVYKAEYRRQCMNLTKSIKKEKIKWESEQASRAKYDLKLIYSYIRSKMDVKEQIKALKDDDVRLIEEKSEIADILNNRFESMFIKEPPDPLPEFENMINVNFGIERLLPKINEFEMGKSLKSLKERKSMCPEQIHPMILKECALEFAKPLTILFW